MAKVKKINEIIPEILVKIEEKPAIVVNQEAVGAPAGEDIQNSLGV